MGTNGLQPNPASARVNRASLELFRRGCGERVVSTWFRAAMPRHAGPQDLISGMGAARHGGRWCPPALGRVLHLADEPEHAIGEFLANHRRFGIPVPADLHLVLRAVQVRLDRVLDLTNPEVRRAFGVSRRRLLDVLWARENAAGREAISQAIGRVAGESGFVGLLVDSAAVPAATNLVIFMDRLGVSDRVEVRAVK